MKKDRLLKLFDQNTKYVAVKVEKEGYDDPEIIITFKKNFTKMKKFYDETYEQSSKGLKNKYSKIPIYITDATILNDFTHMNLFLGIKG